jgi:hypothetical protein
MIILMCFGMKVENGNVRSAGEEDEAPTVKAEALKQIGKGK